MAQCIMGLTLDFGSRHDLMVRGVQAPVGLHADRAEPALDSVSPSLSVPPLHVHVHTLSLKVCMYVDIYIHINI